MLRRPLALALAAGIGLAALSGGPLALAQPSPDARAAAAALFEDGRRLMGENKFAEACPKLEESQRLDPGMGTLYNVSLCYEAIGKTASAWVGFRDVADQAARAGEAVREKGARGKATALETKLMRLKISVASGSGVEVKRDGAVISPALWGTPVPLDPGKHRVSASAPGKEPWEVTIQLDHEGSTVNVDVPPLLDRKPGATPPPPPPPDTRPPPGGGDGTLPPPPGGDAAPHHSWMLPVGITATVVGVAAVAGGVGLGVAAKSEFDSSNSGTMPNCTNNMCNAAGLNQRSDAVSKGNIGTGLVVGGAVVAAAGVVLWIVAPSSHAAHARATAPRTASLLPRPPQIGLSPTGVSLRSVW